MRAELSDLFASTDGCGFGQSVQGCHDKLAAKYAEEFVTSEGKPVSDSDFSIRNADGSLAEGVFADKPYKVDLKNTPWVPLLNKYNHDITKLWLEFLISSLQNNSSLPSFELKVFGNIG